MNLSTKKVYFLSTAIALVLAAMLSVFRSLLLLDGYSPELGHFEEGFAADLFLPLTFVLAIVISIGFGILFRSSLTNRALKPSLPTVFASGLTALALAVWLVTLLWNVVNGKAPVGSQKVITVLITVFAVLAALYFISTAINGVQKSITVLLCCATSVFCVLYPLFAYFDQAFTLNSPIKIFDQITFLLLAIFFLVENRFRFGKISDAVFLPVGMIAVVFTAANAVPGLIYAAKAGEALVVNVMHDFLSFAFCLYVIARMLSFPLADDEQEKQDAFAEELSRVSDAPYEIDNDTHIVENDPRQETFHFDEEEAKDTTPAPAEEIIPPAEEIVTNAQTTLEFDRKKHS